jgi:hypothetical protein
MNNLFTIRFMGALAVLGLASCSTNYSALKGESDDLYFMASDAKVATEFAVQNNNRDNFKQLENITAEEYTPESFSARNVNPEYLAKYQSNQSSPSDEETVYFDEGSGETLAKEGGDINVYNNFRGNSGYNNFNNFNPWSMNPWMMSSMYMGGFSPWGMGMYDPFWGSGFGFRPGFNLSLGLGFGFGSRFGYGFGNPWRYGYGMGLYDPFYSPYYGHGYGYGRPIIIVPGGGENQRHIVRGARPSRGTLATGRRENIASPNSSRASARREAVSRTSTPTTRANSRSDFSRSQNDYYNANARNAATSAAPTRRNVSSPAMSRTNSNTGRDAYTAPSRTLRTTSPSVERGASTPARSRYAAPSRESSPSYNRSATPQYNRTTTPSNNSRNTYSTPSRSSSPSYSAPSRSSGSSGGAVRSSGGSSRRGN